MKLHFQLRSDYLLNHALLNRIEFPTRKRRMCSERLLAKGSSSCVLISKSSKAIDGHYMKKHVKCHSLGAMGKDDKYTTSRISDIQTITIQ